MSEYDKQNVDVWLDELPEEPTALNIIALAVTTPEVEETLEAFFSLSTWERANCLYGLARKTEGHVRFCAQTAALTARAEDRQRE